MKKNAEKYHFYVKSECFFVKRNAQLLINFVIAYFRATIVRCYMSTSFWHSRSRPLELSQPLTCTLCKLSLWPDIMVRCVVSSRIYSPKCAVFMLSEHAQLVGVIGVLPRLNDKMVYSAYFIFIMFISCIHRCCCSFQVIGPKYMENRKPLNLRYTLIVYNFIQVIFSAWLFYEVSYDRFYFLCSSSSF